MEVKRDGFSKKHKRRKNMVKDLDGIFRIYQRKTHKKGETGIMEGVYIEKYTSQRR